MRYIIEGTNADVGTLDLMEAMNQALFEGGTPIQVDVYRSLPLHTLEEVRNNIHGGSYRVFDKQEQRYLRFDEIEKQPMEQV